MGNSSEEIIRVVKEYVLDEFLTGEGPYTLKDETPLMTGGILDSIGTTKLVLFLEETYGMEFLAKEVTPDHMDTPADIARTIRRKMEGIA